MTVRRGTRFEDWLYAAAQTYKASDMTAAIAHSFMALSLKPGDPEASAILAMARLRGGQPADGLRLLGEALVAGGDRPAVRALAGYAFAATDQTLVQLLEQGRLSEAADLLRPLLALDPQLLSPWHRPLGKKRDGLCHALYNHAVEALHEGRLDDAWQAARTVVELAPRHAHGMLLLGVVAGQRGDLSTGLKWLLDAQAIDPALPKLDQIRTNLVARLYHETTALVADGQIDRAVVAARLILEAVPDHPLIRNLLHQYATQRIHTAARHYSAGEMAEAAAVAADALDTAPDHPSAALILGQILLRAKSVPRPPALSATLPQQPEQAPERPPAPAVWRPALPPTETLEETIPRLRYYDSLPTLPDHYYYRQGATLLEWLNLPRTLLVNMRVYHGAAFFSPADYFYRCTPHMPLLVCNRGLIDIYAPHGLDCHVMGTPYIHFRRMREIVHAADAHGTVAFPSPYGHDPYAYRETLAALPEEFRPVTVCLRWKCILEGRHRPYLEYGLPVVTAGHMFEPEFCDNLYGILRRFRYCTANELSTPLLLTTELGLPFLYTGPPLTGANAEDPLQAKVMGLVDASDPRQGVSPELAAFVTEMHGCDSPDIDRDALRWLILKHA